MLAKTAKALLALLALLAVACGGSDAEGLEGGSSPGSGGVSGTGDGSGGSAAEGSGANGGAAGSIGGDSGAIGGDSGAGSAAGGGAGGFGGGAESCALSPMASGTSPRSFGSSGEQREYLLRVPAGYSASTYVPLVLVFHGYFGTASGMQAITALDALADQHGFAVAYGVGVSNSWNAGKCCGTSAFVQRPDVQYVSDLIDDAAQLLCIDQKRVYAMGLSNGGMFSNRLGCALSHRIAAFGAVAGPRAIDVCTPSRPVPVMLLHGTADAIVPYHGGGSGGAEPALASFAFWSQNAACSDAPATVYQQGDASCVERSQCAGGARVRLCTVEGGGHQWFGGPAIPGLGAQSNNIHASSALVDFLLAHSLP